MTQHHTPPGPAGPGPSTAQTAARAQARRVDVVQVVLWVVGLLIAAGAAALTAHGVFSAASDSGVPAGLAWVYPAITDGLALLAYAATPRLTGAARAYAWTVVVVCAGLSGLAQAVYLLSEPTSLPAVHTAGLSPADAAAARDAARAAAEAARKAAVPGLLRFGVGAWPAIAAAIVAHLLFLFSHRHTTTDTSTATPATVEPAPVVEAPVRVDDEAPTVTFTRPALDAGDGRTEHPGSVQPGGVQSPTVQPSGVHPAPPPLGGVQPGGVQRRDPEGAGGTRGRGVQTEGAGRGASPQREKAEHAARAHHARHGAWPSVTELAEAAEVSRGSAHNALSGLRQAAHPLHLVSDQPSQEATP